MLKTIISFLCFSVGIGLSMMVIGEPSLDPLVSVAARCFIAGILFVITSFAIFKYSQYKQLIFYGSLFFSGNALVSLIVSFFWLDSANVSLWPPNLLANHFGWAGEMAEEGLIIEMYYILLLILSGFEGCVFWIIKLLRNQGRF